MKRAISTRDAILGKYERADFPDGFVRRKYPVKEAPFHNAVLESDDATTIPYGAALKHALNATMPLCYQKKFNSYSPLS